MPSKARRTAPDNKNKSDMNKGGLGAISELSFLFGQHLAAN